MYSFTKREPVKSIELTKVVTKFRGILRTPKGELAYTTAWLMQSPGKENNTLNTSRIRDRVRSTQSEDDSSQHSSPSNI